MNALRTIWHDILLVWTFFTRIPAPHFMTTRKLSQALWALPFVAGLITFVQTTILLSLFLLVGNAGFVGLFLLAIPIILTGALHWDGLADTFDGLGTSRINRAKAMRDSRLGTFGVIAVVLALLAQHGLYSYGGLFWPALFFVALGSRALMTLAWAILPAMDSASQASTFGKPKALFPILYLCLAVLGVAVFAAANLLILLFCVVVAALWFLFIQRYFSGISGDTLGATQIIGEILFLCLIMGV